MIIKLVLNESILDSYPCSENFRKCTPQGAKKIIFTACNQDKLKLAFTSPNIILTSPKSFLTSRIDFTVLLLFEFLKKHHLPVGQVKNRIHQPHSKIHQPRVIGPHFLCTLLLYSPPLLKTNFSSFQSDLSKNSQLTGPFNHYFTFFPFLLTFHLLFIGDCI